MASNLTVTIGADASRLRAEVAVAKAAMDDLARIVRRSAQSGARGALDDLGFAKLAQNTTALTEARANFEQLDKQVRIVDRTHIGWLATLNKSRAGLLEMQAAGVNSFQALASGMSPMHVAMMEGAQVIGALVQGGVVGFGLLLSPLGLLSGAALAAGGAIGYMAYQAYQARQTLGGMQAELLLTGRVGSTGIEEAAKSAENLANKFDISKRSAAELLAEIAKSRTLNSEQIQQLAELAAAEGRVRRAAGSETTDIDVAKKFAAALADGAAGAIKLAQSYNIATTAAEQMLKSGNELGAFRTVLADIERHIRSHGGAWAEADVGLNKYRSELEKLLGLPPITARFLAPLGLGPGMPPNVTERPSAGAGLDAGQVVAAAPIPGSPFGDSLNRMIAAAKAAGLDIGITSGTRSRERQQQLWDEALRKYGSEAEARKWVAPPGSSMHERGLAADLRFGPGAREWAHANASQFGINFPLGNEPWHAEPVGGRARSGGAETQFADKAARERAQRDIEQGYREQEIANRNSLQAQIAAAQEHYNKLAEIVRAENPKITAAELAKDSRIEAATLDLMQKRAQLYDQDTGRAIAALRAQQAAATEIRDRIGLQQRVIGTLEARGAPVTQIDAARTELASLQRQASQDAVSIEQEKLGRLTQMGQLELQASTAKEQLLVARRQQSQDQAVAHEAAATDAMLAKRREGAQALVDLAETLGLSARQVDKFKDAVQQIDLERTTRAAQFATKQAEAQQTLIDKWVQPLKSAFDQIGSTIEGAITGLLTRQKTWAAALRDTFNSVISSIVSGIGSTLSKIGAKSLGAVAGEGLGEFIGGKALGWLGGLSLFAFNRGGIVPSAAGGWALPSFAGAQPALLHSREMVLPERISTGLQAAINGGGIGGGGTVINLSAIDSRSGAQFLMSHAETIGRAMQRSRRNFAPA